MTTRTDERFFTMQCPACFGDLSPYIVAAWFDRPPGKRGGWRCGTCLLIWFGLDSFEADFEESQDMKANWDRVLEARAARDPMVEVTK